MNKTRLGKLVLTEAGVAARVTNAAEWEEPPWDGEAEMPALSLLVRCTCGQPPLRCPSCERGPGETSMKVELRPIPKPPK